MDADKPTPRIIRRKDAAALGLLRYFNGPNKPCKNGHIAERLVSNGQCMECARDTANARRAADPIAARARDKVSRTKHREKRNAATRAWNKANPGKKNRSNYNWIEKNKEQHLANRRDYSTARYAEDEEYREAIKAANLRSRKKNPETYRKIQREWHNRRYAENLGHRLKCALRNGLADALRRRRWKPSKKISSAIAALGCSTAELIAYIEVQFRDGMIWNTWASNGPGGWELDHRKALCLFDLTISEEFSAAMHYTNLQPLLIAEHKEKSKRDIALWRELRLLAELQEFA